jgi:3'(2'), 5'-bisphosphate nucleotidase
MPPPANDTAFARWLADQAADLLLALRGSVADPAALRAAGDKQAHDLIATSLARWRPGDAVLSEEGVRDDPARLDADRVWIVDPLDGTREFGEPGRTDWAVHIGLWSRVSSAPFHLAAAAVALPAQGLVWGTDDPPSPTPLGNRAPRLVVSRSRAPEFVTRLADTLGAELVPMGSAGAKIAAVIRGEADAYVHAGGQYEWDSAAPVAIARRAGLHAARLDGSPLRYNRPDPWLPDLVVCRPELVDELSTAMGGVR